MNTTDLMESFRAHADPNTAVQMKRYMRNQFEFLGLKNPLRKSLQKQFVASWKNGAIEDIFVIFGELAVLPYREFFYTGIDLLQASLKKMELSHIHRMAETAAVVSPWWDSVDGLNIAIKKWFALPGNSIYLGEFIEFAVNHESMWVNRLSLICQLHMKGRLNTELLDKAISAFSSSEEFFLQKAIGWILREYSKYNPDYVRDYLRNNTLKPLSVREAGKYI